MGGLALPGAGDVCGSKRGGDAGSKAPQPHKKGKQKQGAKVKEQLESDVR